MNVNCVKVSLGIFGISVMLLVLTALGFSLWGL